MPNTSVTCDGFDAVEYDWCKAEDTFLLHYCDVTTFDWGKRYCWLGGPDLPKFNFIRLLKPNIDPTEFDDLMADSTEFFSRLSKSFVVKIPSSVYPEPPSFIERFTEVGVPLASVKVPHKFRELPPLDQGVELVECAHERDLADFIEVNADGRGEPHDHPVYQVFYRIFKFPTTRFFLLKVDGEPAASTAVDLFDDTFNVWGTAVKSKFKRQRYSTVTAYHITQLIPKDYFMQMNVGDISYQSMLKQRPDLEVRNIEYKYSL